MMPTRNTSESKILTARAPAKLILSGEHSVLYGQPALAMAIDRYTTTTTTWSDTSKIHFNFLDLAYAKSYTLYALQRLTKKIREDYSNKRPFELLQYLVSNLFEILNIKLSRGLNISVGSNIPIGCGMGSSSAAIISTVYALANLLQCNWPSVDYLSFSREVENLQHGKSSGLDLHLVTYGGCVRFENGLTYKRTIPQMPITIVNTGKPESSTGTCVTHVAPIFLNSPDLANKFGSITNQIDAALAANDLLEFKRGIRANHSLLCRIGVVPSKVANFISDIESSGGAAKICGAGAVVGNNAGVVLLVADHDVQDIVHKHGYEIQPIQVDTHGITVI